MPLPEKYGTWIRTRKEMGMTGNNTATLMTIGSIESPNFHCLTFWYHMWGSNLAQFTLSINQFKSEHGANILWLKKVPQSNNWIKESVTIQSYSPYYLMFRATLQPPNGRHEDSIGLDDITWNDGKCPSQSMCDFEVYSHILSIPLPQDIKFFKFSARYVWVEFSRQFLDTVSASTFYR